MISKTLVVVLYFGSVFCIGAGAVGNILHTTAEAIGLTSETLSNGRTTESSEPAGTWAPDIQEEIIIWVENTMENFMLHDGAPEGFLPFYAADAKQVEQKVKLYLYNGTGPSDFHNLTGPVGSLMKQGFKPNVATVLIIHGYGKDASRAAIQLNKDRILTTSVGPINVIGVDWSALCPRPFYIWSRANVKPTGDYLGQWLTKLVRKSLLRPSNIHIVGHSLGAHVAGTAGKAVQGALGKKVQRVTGLDPAGPLFSKPSESRLAKTDAELVDVVHTAVNLLGLRDALGHVDFYANGGTVPQPGCGWDVSASCSHERVTNLFAESVGRPKTFPGRRCLATGDVTEKICTGTVAHMGYNGTFREQGRYYFKTADEEPFDPASHNTTISNPVR